MRDMTFNKLFLDLWLLPALLTSSVAGIACYNPGGSLVTSPAFQPCNQFAGAVSMCCGTNHTGGEAPDTCEDNGLCLQVWENTPQLWRQSCTDQTWSSPYCLKRLCDSSDVSALLYSLCLIHLTLVNSWAYAGDI